MEPSVGASAGATATRGPVGPNYPPGLAAQAPAPPAATDDGAVAELAKFANAVAQSAQAEWSLTLAAAARTMTHGAISLLSAFIAWSFGLVAVLIGLSQWLSPLWAFSILSLVHVAVGAYAWKRRLLWQRRIGFGRTGAAIATALGLRTPPP